MSVDKYPLDDFDPIIFAPAVREKLAEELGGYLVTPAMFEKLTWAVAYSHSIQAAVKDDEVRRNRAALADAMGYGLTAHKASQVVESIVKQPQQKKQKRRLKRRWHP